MGPVKVLVTCKPKMIDLKEVFLQQVTEHSRNLWRQNHGNQVIIALAVSVVNLWGIIGNIVTRVLQPQASRVFCNL